MESQKTKPILTLVLVAAALMTIVGVTIYRRGAAPDGAQPEGPKGSRQGGPAMLTVGFDEAPRATDPRLVGFDANSQYLEELRFLPLVSFDEEGKTRPLVAETITATDASTFVVKIRPGLKFADGKPITPHDVVATYRHMLQPSGNFPPSPRKGAFEGVLSVFKSSADEVTFKLRKPDAAFPTNLVIGILPEHASSAEPEKVDGKGFESGPYILESRTESEWILARNEAFDGSAIGIPSSHHSKVRFLIIRDETTRYAALVRGDIDILQNALDADRVAAIQRNPKLKVMTRPRMGLDYLGMATHKGDLARPEVRRALAHGINRDEILKFTLQNQGTKATGTFPPESDWHTELPEVTFDPQKAEALLDQAGLTKSDTTPHRLAFTLKITTNKTRIAVAKAIAAQLANIGVKVNVESLEFGVFMDQLKQGAITAWLGAWTGFKDPDHLHFAFNSSMVPPNGGNRGHYANGQVDLLTAKGKQETDPAKRKALYDEAQSTIAADQPYVFLWHPLSVVVTQSNISGFRMHSDGRYLSLTEVKSD